MVASPTQSSNHVRVRRARLGQAKAVARVIRKSFGEYKRAGGGPRSAFWTGKQVKRNMATGRIGYWLAYVGRKPVGVVRMDWRNRVLVFSRLSVLPGYRRRGIGTRLMREVAVQARARGAVRIRGYVLRSLPRLIRYYRRMGYTLRKTKRGLTVASKRLKYGSE